MTKLRVHKKGYHRKGFTAHRDHHVYHVKPTTVPASSFEITDRGARGRGAKVVTIKHKGELGGHDFFSKSVHARHATYRKLAEKKGEKHVVGQLRAIQVFNKRVNPELSRKAYEDSHWVAGEFKGHRDVGYPRVFRRKLSKIA